MLFYKAKLLKLVSIYLLVFLFKKLWGGGWPLLPGQSLPPFMVPIETASLPASLVPIETAM